MKNNDLVTSYNEMMQSFYKNDSGKETTKKFAAFLLSIRKDVYKKNTKLNSKDMLKFQLKDVDNLLK